MTIDDRQKISQGKTKKMTRLPISLVFLFNVLVALHFPPALAAEPDEDLRALRSEIESLKEGQQAIRQELRDIKELLRDRQPARGPTQDVEFSIKIANDPAKGATDARVTLIEFSDYGCPFCARHTRSVMPQLEKAYIATNKIRYVLRDYPLQSIHPQAPKAHEAAHCAGEQGKHWEMHGQLMANQKNLQVEQLSMYAQRIRVEDLATFDECLASGKYAQKIRSSVVEGAKGGVKGTPSFLLGVTGEDGSVKVLKLIQGAQSYAVFQKAIDELIVTSAVDGTARQAATID